MEVLEIAPFEVFVEHGYLKQWQEFILLIPGMMAMAALFVFKPEKFKALPYIVLAVVEIYFVYSAFWIRGCNGAIREDYPDNCMIHYSVESIVCSAIPIVVLLVLQIVRTIQKKKVES